MKKIAFFLEGKTEQILVERLLTEIAGTKDIQIEKHAARGTGTARFITVSGRHGQTGTKYYALLVDCGSDNSVVSDVRDQYESLAKSGYSSIVGIRDVYPNPRTDIPKLTRWMYYGVKTKPIKPELLLAVMEVECWFIGEHTHFERIDAGLTLPVITTAMGFDPSTFNVEDRDHPAEDLDTIYKLAGKAYKKDRKRIQRTVEALDSGHMYLAVAQRLASLGALVNVIDGFLS